MHACVRAFPCTHSHAHVHAHNTHIQIERERARERQLQIEAFFLGGGGTEETLSPESSEQPTRQSPPVQRVPESPKRMIWDRTLEQRLGFRTV